MRRCLWTQSNNEYDREHIGQDDHKRQTTTYNSEQNRVTSFTPSLSGWECIMGGEWCVYIRVGACLPLPSECMSELCGVTSEGVKKCVQAFQC